MQNDCVVVIPARFNSVRLPGKPLVDINGKPMIQWVYERAVESGVSEVLIATDDERIISACKTFGAQAELTAKKHQSGTDRIAELAKRFNWPDEKVVINVQGDEPLLPPSLISQVEMLINGNSDADMATLVAPIKTLKEWKDPDTVKVVTDCNKYALYFSRAPIPWPRDDVEISGQRHIGIYAYRVWALRKLASSKPCALEKIESLEQLRALWLGLSVRVAFACEPPSTGVDTYTDLELVRNELLGKYKSD